MSHNITVAGGSSVKLLTAGKYCDQDIIVTATGVNEIPDNYIDTSDATATGSDILEGETAYVNGEKITGNIKSKSASDLSASGATVTVPSGYYASQATKSVTTATQATPSISVSSAGLITASATQTAGYVEEGTKTATKQLTTQAAKTVTPTTSNQTAVASGRYTTGTVTVKGDANLVAENIKSGVSIFGVTGTLAGAEYAYATKSVPFPSGSGIRNISADFSAELQTVEYVTIMGTSYNSSSGTVYIQAFRAAEDGSSSMVVFNGAKVTYTFSAATTVQSSLTFYAVGKKLGA